jgi:hypothetical protein
MRYFNLLTLLVLLSFSCSQTPGQKAEQLMKKAIVSHNNMQKWDKLTGVKFNKWERKFDQSDSIVGESERDYEFRLQPFFEGKVTWHVDSLVHVASYDGSKMHYKMGENEIQNPGFLKAKKEELQEAFLSFSQPWELINQEGKPIYDGQKTLENGKTVESIKLVLNGGALQWWVYLDAVTYLIQANEIQIGDRHLLIENLSMNDKWGYLFPGDQAVFRLDVNGKKVSKTAEWRFSEYEVVVQ